MQPNQLEEILKQGQRAIDAGDYRGALLMLLPLAEAGHVLSQSLVGFLYMESFYRVQEVEEAGGWDTMTREQLLAWEELDNAEALRWLTLASDQGDGASSHNLAMLYSKYPTTIPLAQRKVIAKRLLRQGYEQGCVITAFDEDDIAYMASLRKRSRNDASVKL